MQCGMGQLHLAPSLGVGVYVCSSAAFKYLPTITPKHLFTSVFYGMTGAPLSTCSKESLPKLDVITELETCLCMCLFKLRSVPLTPDPFE